MNCLLAIFRTVAFVVAIFLLPVTSSPEVSHNRSSTKRFRHGRVRGNDGSSCELEIVCRSLTGGSGQLMMPVRLPIKGPRGLMATAGAATETGCTDCRQTCASTEGLFYFLSCGFQVAS